MFVHDGGALLADAGGDRDALRRVVDPELADLIDQLQAKVLLGDDGERSHSARHWSRQPERAR
jgi:hypothetical protein